MPVNVQTSIDSFLIVSLLTHLNPTSPAVIKEMGPIQLPTKSVLAFNATCPNRMPWTAERSISLANSMSAPVSRKITSTLCHFATRGWTFNSLDSWEACVSMWLDWARYSALSLTRMRELNVHCCNDTRGKGCQSCFQIELAEIGDCLKIQGLEARLMI